MGYGDFVQQLRALGHTVQELGNNRVCFPYTIPLGKFKGKQISLGFEVPGDCPNSPPGGPHIRPQLLPIKQGGPSHPQDAVNPSPFGTDWEYWSRPFQGWADFDHTVKVYMTHIRNLFETQ